jgi:hypothetical protein
MHLAIRESRDSKNITGARFTIDYGTGRRAEISMMEIPTVSGAAPFDDLRAEFERLGKAIQDAAGSPDNISWDRETHLE